jgi:hypothetical protein
LEQLSKHDTAVNVKTTPFDFDDEQTVAKTTGISGMPKQAAKTNRGKRTAAAAESWDNLFGFESDATC